RPLSPLCPLLRFSRSCVALRRHHVRQFVGFLKPVSNGCFHLIPVSDVNDVVNLGLRRAVGASHLRGLQRATEKHAEFEKALLRTHKEVAGLAGEHDRLVRCVNPLITKGNGSLAQPLPSILQILREILGQSDLGGRPAVVLVSFLNPLLAVVALSTGHPSSVTIQQSRRISRPILSAARHTGRVAQACTEKSLSPGCLFFTPAGSGSIAWR